MLSFYAEHVEACRSMSKYAELPLVHRASRAELIEACRGANSPLSTFNSHLTPSISCWDFMLSFYAEYVEARRSTPRFSTNTNFLRTCTNSHPFQKSWKTLETLYFTCKNGSRKNQLIQVENFTPKNVWGLKLKFIQKNKYRIG